MKIGDEVTLKEINKWKNSTYKDSFNTNRFGKKDGQAWWSKTKRNILNNTKFKVIQLQEGEK